MRFPGSATAEFCAGFDSTCALNCSYEETTSFCDDLGVTDPNPPPSAANVVPRSSAAILTPCRHGDDVTATAAQQQAPPGGAGPRQLVRSVSLVSSLVDEDDDELQASRSINTSPSLSGRSPCRCGLGSNSIDFCRPSSPCAESIRALLIGIVRRIAPINSAS